MKQIVSIMLLVCMLAGCAQQGVLDQALTLRAAILGAECCSFQLGIVADYGDAEYQFSMVCKSDAGGNVTFTVTKPETIAGIGGRITGDGGNLVFDDILLAIPMLTDDQITPVSAPWILMRTLRGGYITSCAPGQITIDDSYADDALKLDITLDEANMPVFAEVYWKERRILTLEVENFQLS